MKMKAMFIVPIILVVVFGGIGLSKTVGLWETESKKEATVVSEGEFSGMLDPLGIKGSFTLGDVEAQYGVPVEILAKAFMVVGDNPAAFQVKEIKTLFLEIDPTVEVGVGAVRTFVGMYIGVPYESEDALPESAINVLKEIGKYIE